MWRYLPTGRVKHALMGDILSVTGHRSEALCGTSPRWFMPSEGEWYGTGSQAEYETVGRLPECRRCARLLGPAQEVVSRGES